MRKTAASYDPERARIARESDFFNPSVFWVRRTSHTEWPDGVRDRCRRSAAVCQPPATSHSFTELRQRHAMTQTSEPRIKTECGKGKSIGEKGARTTNAEHHAICDNSEHLRFATADLEANAGPGFAQRWRRIGVPAARSATAPQPDARWDELWMQQIAGATTALLFASLAPALVMAALWHTAEVAPIAFVFTFVIALVHAVLLGLPLFLVLRSKGWINAMTCVVLGFAVGAVPHAVMTWPTHHLELHASVFVDSVRTIINGIITSAGLVDYVKPVIYCGLLGTLGGLAFRVALICSGTRTEPRV